MHRLPKGVQRTTIRLAPDLLRDVDRLALIRGCSRSALVSALLREELHEQMERVRKAVRS